ncbi:hypothetical protein FRC12_005917 [Ceratobasidium sp. 428]|nr:hypothetical protein FRC12_005917 [Ceratobasidium sp. 428]
MSSTQVAATPFSIISDVFYTLLERGLLLFALAGLSSTDKTLTQQPTIPAPLPTIPPRKRLPMLIRYMSSTRKAMLRATYARDITLFRPGSAQLPLAQRFLASPITLSGPDGSINVALRPLAAQVNLGHEYTPEPTPCPSPRVEMHMSSQAEVRETLAGATAVLNALVRGAVDEEWLNAPSIKSKPLVAPLMTRSYAQFGDEGMKMRRASTESTDSESSGVHTPTRSKDARATIQGREVK